MKYKAIIDTDDYEDFEFFEDSTGKYLHAVDAGSVNGEWIALHFTEAVTEQEIVKPYFDKLKEQINEQIDGGLHNNDYGVGWDDALSEVLDMIDKILSEQEKEK